MAKWTMIVLFVAASWPAFVGSGMVNAEIEMQHRFCGGHLCYPITPVRLF